MPKQCWWALKNCKVGRTLKNRCGLGSDEPSQIHSFKLVPLERKVSCGKSTNPLQRRSLPKAWICDFNREESAPLFVRDCKVCREFSTTAVTPTESLGTSSFFHLRTKMGSKGKSPSWIKANHHERNNSEAPSFITLAGKGAGKCSFSKRAPGMWHPDWAVREWAPNHCNKVRSSFFLCPR